MRFSLRLSRGEDAGVERGRGRDGGEGKREGQGMTEKEKGREKHEANTRVKAEHGVGGWGQCALPVLAEAVQVYTPGLPEAQLHSCPWGSVRQLLVLITHLT